VLVTQALDVPVIYQAHHTYRQAHRRISAKRALSIVEARAYRRAARVLAVSQSTADAVAAIGVPVKRIEVLPPGINVPEAPLAIREAGRLLFVGRLEAEKGVLDALAVMERLSQQRTDTSGCVIGSGRLGTVVRTRVASARRIEYLGAVDQATLHREYARAALLLMPSR